jgi:DNA polymerase I
VKNFLIFDSNSVIHRAYHALPPLTNKEGILTNAVYGFLLAFFKAIKDFRPEFAAAAFDVSGPTFRHEKFKDYKANRPPADKELYAQIPMVKEILGDFGVEVFGKEGFEADDLIGAMASKAKGVSTVILTGDTDNLQLVDENTKVYMLRRGVKDAALFDEAAVSEKFFGLKPRQLIDYKALKGDQSDNIPGVPGIGEKTAADLIFRFKSVENLYIEIGKGTEIKPKTKEALLANRDQAFFSKKLVEIEKNVPMEFEIENCKWEFDEQKAAFALEKFGFQSLLKRLPEIKGEKEGRQVLGANKKNNPQDEPFNRNLKLW